MIRATCRARRALVAAAACAALVAGCRGKDGDVRRSAIAGPASLRDVARLTGTVEPVVQVELKSEVSGRIQRIPVREGARLARGQVVAEIDAEQLRNRRARLALAVERTRLARRTAIRDLERARALREAGTLSADRLEDLELAVSRADLDLREASIALREVETDIARCRVRAPMVGTLISLDVEEGEIATSATSGVSGGTVLGKIADLARMQVEVEVSELDFPRLRLGQRVEVTTEAAPGRVIPGHVAFVSSSAREGRENKSIRVFPVEVELDTSSSALVPGMTVNVDFVFLERKAPIAVPFDMVKEEADRSQVVFVRGSKGFAPRAVRTGATDFRQIEIVSGLRSGDTIWEPPADGEKRRGGR